MARGRSGRLRIIGGEWRGRKLAFDAAPGLRPTTDRVRETLFNWLAQQLPGARCLDLFAGSGALGLEALSRGASHVDFVDTSRRALQQISKHLGTLQASSRAGCHTHDALGYLQTAPAPYDIVFVDPPFEAGLAEPACAALFSGGLVNADACVYLESAVSEGDLKLPTAWALHRDKRAGAVRYRLLLA
ncbi:MAG: 16S rRNA (guanine(966)-N(2))-methyltransferase RsmD [Pseudomonadota bacterium]